MANPRTAAECIRVATYSDPTLKELKSTPGWSSYSIGGSGTVNVYFFDENGEIEGSAQLGLTITTEVGIMGIPGIVFPVQVQSGQGVAETNLPQAIWLEIVAASGTLTQGRYGTGRDYTNTGLFLKSGSHLTYALKVGASLRCGPAPSPHLGVNGALEVDDDSSTSAMIVSPILSTATNVGGTITLGGTAQTIAVANAARQGGYIYNPKTATESLFVSESGTATANSPEITPGGMFQIMATNAISLLGATTGHIFDAEVR